MRIEHNVIDSGNDKPEEIVRGAISVTVNEEVTRETLKDNEGNAYAEVWQIGTQRIMTYKEWEEYRFNKLQEENALLEAAVMELAEMIGGES